MALSGAQLRSDVTAFIAREHAPAQQLIDVERQRAFDQLRPWSLKGPGRVKTRSVLFVGGVSGDPGGIVRLGAANSAELVRADA